MPAGSVLTEAPANFEAVTVPGFVCDETDEGSSGITDGATACVSVSLEVFRWGVGLRPQDNRCRGRRQEGP